MLIIVAGVAILILGVILSMLGIGSHHEAAEGAAAAHGAGHAGAEHHGSAPWLKRIIVSLWHSNVFFMGVSAIGTVFMAIQYVAYAGWSVVVKRINEALSAWLIPGLVIMLVVFGLSFINYDLFHWTARRYHGKGQRNLRPHHRWQSRLPEHSVLPDSHGHLPGHLWIFFTKRLRELSLEEDLNGGTAYFHKSINVSALFLVFYAVTSSMSAWDWVMSVDVHWFSTMFGWYVFASWWVSGIAAITLTAIFLKQAGYLRCFNATTCTTWASSCSVSASSGLTYGSRNSC